MADLYVCPEHGESNPCGGCRAETAGEMLMGDDFQKEARAVIDRWRDEWHLEPELEMDGNNSKVYESLVDHVATALRAPLSPASAAPVVDERCIKCEHDLKLPRQINGWCATVVRDAGGSLIYCGCKCESTAAAATAAPVAGWLPIETAPRDGTRILVWLPESENVLSVYWDEQFTFRFDEEKGKSVDYQGEYEGAWTDDAVKSWAYQEKESYNPTYWKPVPAPPVTIP